MATLNLKNFPDPLYERLQKRAQQERRSLAQEVIHLLDHVTQEQPTLSILDLQGLGKECWQGIDAAAYIDEERNSWDS